MWKYTGLWLLVVSLSGCTWNTDFRDGDIDTYMNGPGPIVSE